MRKQELFRHVLDYFRQTMDDTETELNYSNPFELLVAVVLSAQCTDKRINMVTPALFAAYPTPADMAAASVDDIFSYIRSVSYPNNKARHLQGLAEKLVTDFGGEVPQTLEELTTLPGVGRKTANVMGAVLWQREVMPVDTHVFRVSARIGLTRNAKTPLQAEQQLEAGFPSHLLPIAHHWLILHGRYTCTARAPKCADCGIAEWCASRNKYMTDR